MVPQCHSVGVVKLRVVNVCCPNIAIFSNTKWPAPNKPEWSQCTGPVLFSTGQVWKRSSASRGTVVHVDGLQPGPGAVETEGGPCIAGRPAGDVRPPLYNYGAGGFCHKILPKKKSPRNPPRLPISPSPSPSPSDSVSPPAAATAFFAPKS